MLKLLLTLIIFLLSCSPSWAAWAHRQTGFNSDGGGATTLTFTYGSAVLAGSLLRCFITSTGGTPVSGVSDSVNGAWTLAKAVDEASNFSTSEYYFPNSAAGTPTITVTYSGSTATRKIIASEYTGIALTNPVDVTAGDEQQNTGTGTDAVTSGPTTSVAQNGSLAVGSSLCDVTTALQYGTGFTGRSNQVQSNYASASEDKTVNAGDTPAGTFTTDNASSDPSTIIVVYKAAPSGGLTVQGGLTVTGGLIVQ